ncbi:MAG TPA: HAMP domain-containing sensor histidine kinase [Patescibacteria group bacterium]|jgi:signal transduction histidine kinase|nr:HAMP domain-containing sensor histidine kinase [Patescibacteria group bacterium]
MAIKASGYFKYYQSATTAVLLLLQLTVILSIGILVFFVLRIYDYPVFNVLAVGLFVLIIFESMLTILMVNVYSRPLKTLSQAIAYVSKDALQTLPPTLSTNDSRSGLKALVDTVYGLAASNPASLKTTNPITEAILGNLPCGVIALEADGQILFANAVSPVSKNSSGKLQAELLFEQSNSLESWLNDCQANKVHDLKIWHRIADRIPGQDGRRIFDIVGSYTKNSPNGIETLLVTIDRTEEYSPEEDSMDFIALAAHELRGPITIIRGYLDILDQELRNTLQANQRQIIDRLQVSAERLSGYVNNVLNVSRYDRNHLRLHLHEERLVDIIKNLVPDLALRARTQNRRLKFFIPDDLPTIAADSSSLSEVIINLIDNAIKYSKKDGEVDITATVKDSFVEITVQDFGIGMPESVVSNLFTKFYRSHRSRQQVSGTGLGLYICKAIAESHGGKIWARTKEGAGSTFGFTIPIYTTIADKLTKDNNSNEQIIEKSDGWIKNHAMYRR